MGCKRLLVLISSVLAAQQSIIVRDLRERVAKLTANQTKQLQFVLHAEQAGREFIK